LRFNGFFLVTFDLIRVEILKFKFLWNVRFWFFFGGGVILTSIQKTALPCLQGQAVYRKVWEYLPPRHFVASQMTRTFEILFIFGNDILYLQPATNCLPSIRKTWELICGEVLCPELHYPQSAVKFRPFHLEHNM
jgi:hypothetical protein